MTSLRHYVMARDVDLFFLFNKRLHSEILDFFMQRVSQLGSLIFAVGLILYFLLFQKHELALAGIKMAVVLAISQLIVQSVKRIVNRPRPFRTLNHVISNKPPTCVYSFPSGHTCAAFSLAFVLSGAFPILTVGFMGLASLVGMSRIYLGAHYPTDVFVGFLIAYASFAAENTFLISSLFNG